VKFFASRLGATATRPDCKKKILALEKFTPAPPYPILWHIGNLWTNPEEY
jgi:hypothetical protein